MLLIAQILLLFLFLFITLLFGYIITVLALKEKDKLTVYTFSIIIGLNSYLFLVNYLSKLIPLGITQWLLLVLMLLASIVLIFINKNKLRPKEALTTNLKKSQLKKILITAFIISCLSGLLAIRVLQLDDMSIAHLPTAATISQGNLPVMDPVAPDISLFYHYAPELFSALLYNIANIPLWLGYDLQTFLFSGLTFLLAFILAYKIIKNYRSSFLAAFLFLYGSGPFIFTLSKYQLDAVNFFEKYFIPTTIPGITTVYIYAINNHTTVLGMPIILFLFYSWFKIIRQEKNWLGHAIVSGIMFGFLSLSLDTAFVVILSVFFLLILLKALFKNNKLLENEKNLIKPTLIISLIGVIMAFTQGGVLSSLNDRPESSLSSFHLIKDFWVIHFSYLDTTIFSLNSLFEIWIIAILFFFAYKNLKNYKRIKILSIFALLAFIIPFIIGYSVIPHEMTRFFILSIPIFSFIIGLYLLNNLKIINKNVKFIIILLTISAINLQVVHILFPINDPLSTTFIKKPKQETSLEKQASIWIKNNTTINDYFYPADWNFILRTGRITPHQSFWPQQSRIDNYNKINLECDKEAIKKFNITYFYVKPIFPMENFEKKCFNSNVQLLKVFEKHENDNYIKIFKIINL